MSAIFFLMGKSASGKDGLGRMLLDDRSLDLRPVILYTTRPMREGEVNGREYYFVTPLELEELRGKGRIIEERVYHTVQGDWYYFTCADDEMIRSLNDHHKYLAIGTIEAYLAYKKYFGEEKVIPLYIDVRDDLRLMRAIERESRQQTPDYKEICRRFLADEEDFSEENLKKAGIKKAYRNDGNIRDCYEELKSSMISFGNVNR